MKRRQRILKPYQDYHKSPPSVLWLIGQNLRYYLLLILFAAAAIFLFFTVQRPIQAYFLLGILTGALIRDVGYFVRYLKTWPVTESVVDWERVEALLAEQPGKLD